MSLTIPRRGTMAGRGGTPTTYTFYSVEDGYASLSGSATEGVTPIYVGGTAGPAWYEMFLAFDTSTVVGTVISAALSLYGSADQSLTDFTIEARQDNWGPGLTWLGDWVIPNDMAALPLVATFDTAGFTASGYNTFTSDPSFPAHINKAGRTQLMLNSSRHRNGFTPSGNEYVGVSSSTSPGTGQDPKLVVVAVA